MSFMMHCDFDIKIKIFNVHFWGKGGGHKEYSVYAFDNSDNSGHKDIDILS